MTRKPSRMGKFLAAIAVGAAGFALFRRVQKGNRDREEGNWDQDKNHRVDDVDEQLEDALEATFPASDPFSVGDSTGTNPARPPGK